MDGSDSPDCGAGVRTGYHRAYYQQNRDRRRAQRLASKYGHPGQWREFLHMGLNRYAARRDENEGDIVAELLANGFEVFKLNKPLDLLVWRPNGVGFVLLEVKTGAGRTTAQQDEFLAQTKGLPRAVVRTALEALEAARQWA